MCEEPNFDQTNVQYDASSLYEQVGGVVGSYNASLQFIRIVVVELVCVCVLRSVVTPCKLHLYETM